MSVTHSRRSLSLYSPIGPYTEELLQQPAKFGLGMIPERLQPDATTNMVCGFCSTGCGLHIHLREGQAINLTPATNYPVNLGMACPKGWEALTPLSAPDRGTVPLLRDGDDQLKRSDWDTALREFCTRFKDIQSRHGEDSLAFLSTGQMATEEMAYLGSLAKFGMGIRHGDGNTRQCMATAVVAYKQSFGFDAPPYTYEDFEQSDVIVLVGANLCIAHPIMWQRVLRNPNHPEIIVVDPRVTETAVAASEHLQLKPKSDLALFYGLAHILIANGWIDESFIENHTNDFASFAKFAADFSPESVAATTGIPANTLLKIAKIIHEGKRVSFWWTMGVNQSYEGVRVAQSIVNLALMTGNIGRPGTGANSITGQCNAMGSRLFSNTTSLLGGRDFSNPRDREDVASQLGIDESRIPRDAGWAYDEIIDGIRSGKVKGLWVVCTNPAHSWIDQAECRDLLDRLDFLVVQDMYPTTETARAADLYLPAAGWGEKNGTLINSERRIGVIKKVSRAPGQAMADLSIFRMVAEYWGCGKMFERWTDAESIFRSLATLSKGQPCDFSGIKSYSQLDQAGGIQWPFPADDDGDVDDRYHASQRRLFGDGQFFHADGKAKFLFESPCPMPEPPCDEYPFLLLTGRGTASQWHTRTRTQKSPVLRQLSPAEIYVEIHPDDAVRLCVTQNDVVHISSRRGNLDARVRVTAGMQAGQVFIPMHYEETNRLTLAHFDPYSRQPSYKNCAVCLTKQRNN